uniref:hypothetical protein n=1 Tax=Thaumasiovibrio occultus TaxID=1891184 RepID=UPI000B34ECE9|nr:hypothetical protein [Thaumasiovibrio occultus]
MKILHSLSLLIFFSVNAFALNYEPIEQDLLDLPEHNADCRDIHQIDEGYALAMCQYDELDTSDNYGWRLTVFEYHQDQWQVASVSKGYYDAYSVTLNFFAAAEGNTLIFAESAAEYSWGFSVFEWSDNQPLRLGSIDECANNLDSSSLLPYLDIQRHDTLEISFTTEAYYEDVEGSEILPAGSVKYVLENGKLVRHRVAI